jgi:hypothetical protein
MLRPRGSVRLTAPVLARPAMWVALTGPSMAARASAGALSRYLREGRLQSQP